MPSLSDFAAKHHPWDLAYEVARRLGIRDPEASSVSALVTALNDKYPVVAFHLGTVLDAFQAWAADVPLAALDNPTAYSSYVQYRISTEQDRDLLCQEVDRLEAKHAALKNKRA